MAATKSTATAAEVREWAATKGIEVGVRGRISADLAKAYNKGHARRPFPGSPHKAAA